MDCLFCKIVEGKIPANIIYEDEQVIAFNDINPQAPVHFLVIPKRHIASICDMTEDDRALVGHMVFVGQKVAAEQGCDNGFRTVFNCNTDGGQTVYHIHLHVLGKRQMTWPPG